MQKTKTTEQQIAFAMHQTETGTRVAEVCRKMGISDTTFYNRKKIYGWGCRLQMSGFRVRLKRVISPWPCAPSRY